MATASKSKTAEKTVETMVESGKEKFEQAYKATTEAATKNLEKSFEMTQKQFEEAQKNFGEMSGFSKENLDALVASTNAAAKGAEQISAELMAYSKKSVEDSLAAVKALSGAKNLREYFDLQNSLAKDSYDNFVAETSRFTEMYMKMANDVFEPVNSRFATAMERFGAAS
ncbi:MAG: hypothetical protein Tsb0016_03590 [Sphingomonadales bacterium]